MSVTSCGWRSRSAVVRDWLASGTALASGSGASISGLADCWGWAVSVSSCAGLVGERDGASIRVWCLNFGVGRLLGLGTPRAACSRCCETPDSSGSWCLARSPRPCHSSPRPRCFARTPTSGEPRPPPSGRAPQNGPPCPASRADPDTPNPRTTATGVAVSLPLTKSAAAATLRRRLRPSDTPNPRTTATGVAVSLPLTKSAAAATLRRRLRPRAMTKHVPVIHSSEPTRPRDAAKAGGSGASGAAIRAMTKHVPVIHSSEPTRPRDAAKAGGSGASGAADQRPASNHCWLRRKSATASTGRGRADLRHYRRQRISGPRQTTAGSGEKAPPRRLVGDVPIYDIIVGTDVWIAADDRVVDGRVLRTQPAIHYTEPPVLGIGPTCGSPPTIVSLTAGCCAPNRRFTTRNRPCWGSSGRPGRMPVRVCVGRRPPSATLRRPGYPPTRRRKRAARSDARSRLCGPSAAVRHSSATWLSTDTTSD